VAEKLAEKEKMEAEEKAKLEKQIEEEVQKRLAEKEAEKKGDEKKVEKVVIVEKKAPEVASSEPAPKPASGWVKLYDDKGFTDRILTVRFGRDIGNMHYVSSDDGKSGFNDKASAARYSIPDGWQAVLYENNNYSKRGHSLTGSGSTADLGYFSDKCSSLRWERK
jgi:hypothetical protein